jgi:diguanylate cyclase (GGDEF)-like protein
MPLTVRLRALWHGCASGARAGTKLVATLDPWWLAIVLVSLGSLLMVSGWPDQAGRVSGDLMIGQVVALSVTVLLYATRQAEAQLMCKQLRATEHRQFLASQLAVRALTGQDLPLLLQEATTLVASSLDIEYCAILESRADDGALVLRAGFGWPDSSLDLPVMAHILASPTLPVSLRSRPPAPWQPGHTVRSSMSVSLEVGQHLYGVLDIYTARERVFNCEEAQFLQTVGDILGAAIEHTHVAAARHAHEAELSHRAFHDTLTGLPNRALFEDRLNHAMARIQRDPAPIAVLFIDLDDFKAINDTLGHSAGDDVLIRVADCLTGCLRDGDTAARFGGDEFAIVLEPATEAEATHVADRIQHALRSIAVPDLMPHVSASIGIAVSDAHSRDSEAMVRQADLAMYRAKSTHQPRVGALGSTPSDTGCARENAQATSNRYPTWATELM